jgi:hypothetical protein
MIVAPGVKHPTPAPAAAGDPPAMDILRDCAMMAP